MMALRTVLLRQSLPRHWLAQVQSAREFQTSNCRLVKDYYGVLGVAKNANQKDIKKAYYQLAKKYHPDTNKDDPTSMKKFQEVSEAYEVLSDESKKADYDSFGGAGGAGGSHQGGNPFQGFSARQGQQGGFRKSGRKAGGVQWEYNSNVDPEELFRQIFGEFSRTRPGMRGFTNPFDDIFQNFQFRGGLEASCHVSFLEAAKGTNKTVEVEEVDRAGRRQVRQVMGPIPAGISDGQTLRLSLGGGREVFITCRVGQSDYFRREGYNLHSTAFISLSQALLGGIIRITGLHEDINLRIPPGTSSHTEMTLSGRGIKHMESYNTRGDHIVLIMIKMPAYMTDEQKELIREYAYLEKDTPGTVNGVDRNSFIFRRKKQEDGGSKAESAEKTSHEAEAQNTETKTAEKGLLSKLSDAVGSIKTRLFG